MAVVAVTIRSAQRGDLDEKRNKYARTGFATNFIAHTRGAEGSGEEKTIVGSAEPYPGQRV